MTLEGIDQNCLFVRMEDLTSYPEEIMRSIYEYVGLDTFAHDFDNVKQTTIEDDSVYGLSPDLHKIRTKVEPVTPYYYDILGKEICDWIDNRFNSYQKRFNYS